jgi:hypothetical protein
MVWSCGDQDFSETRHAPHSQQLRDGGVWRYCLLEVQAPGIQQKNRCHAFVSLRCCRSELGIAIEPMRNLMESDPRRLGKTHPTTVTNSPALQIGADPAVRRGASLIQAANPNAGGWRDIVSWTASTRQVCVVSQRDHDAGKHRDGITEQQGANTGGSGIRVIGLLPRTRRRP